jgi:hypothetical protein
MQPESLHGTESPHARRAFILRYGILRYGLVLGVLMFAWVVTGKYGTALDHLRTPAGWLRLVLLLVVCIGEWVIGAGWLIGMLLWYLRGRGLSLRQRPPGAGS